jgi:Flp pilus assembly protein TadD
MRNFFLPAIMITTAITLANSNVAQASMTQPALNAVTPMAQSMPLERVVEAVRANPSDLGLRRQLVQALINKGLAVKAAEQMRGILVAGGRTADDYAMMGDASRYAGDFTTAVKSYKNALTLAPMSSKAWAGLSLAYGTSGDLATAFQTCQHGLAQISDPTGRGELTAVLGSLRGMQLSRAAGSIASVSVTP